MEYDEEMDLEDVEFQLALEQSLLQVLTRLERKMGRRVRS